MDQFAAYGHALASLAGWALIVFVLIALSTRGRSAEARCDCGKPKRDYANRWYRSERALMNAVEISGPFVAVTIAAILSGAAPFWVNLFASGFIVTRVLMAYVHIATTNQPMRSAFWALGILCILALVVLTFGAVF